MKRKLFLLLIPLLAVLGCQRDSLTGDAGNTDVNARFVFNVSTASTATKQGSLSTQASGKFRGISDAMLMTYKLGSDGSILSADATADRVYNLSSLISTANTRRVLEMSLPLNTNTMLLYGRAPEPETANYGEYGHLDNFSITNLAGSTNIQLGRRLSDDDYTEFQNLEKLMAGMFTVIMNTTLTGAHHTEINSGSTPSGGGNTYKYSFDGNKTTYNSADETPGYPNIRWSDYNNEDGKSPLGSGENLFPLEEQLKALYVQMTTIRSTQGELRAGSGEASLRIMADLWSVINAIRCADPLCPEEAIAKYFAQQVHTRLLVCFTPDGTVSSTGGTVSIQSVNTDAATAETINADMTASWPTEDAEGSYKPETVTSAQLQKLNNFPFNFHLPRGAVYVAFDNSKKCFYYPQTFDTSAMGDPSAGATYNATSYYYPSELLYFGNSPLRVSNKEHSVDDYSKTSITDWYTDSNWSAGTTADPDWSKNAHVLSSTRSVALQYEVNYGVAMLETKVAYAGANQVLEDNRKAVVKMSDPNSDEPNNQIVVDGDSFKLTGIIIGGQYRNVGWDYLPCVAPGESKKVTGFIYDNAIPEGASAIPVSGTSGSTYTLVFDNFAGTLGTGGIWTPSATGQETVYVALEFQNNSGRDFYGNCNLIRKEGYFYLIGALTAPKETSGTYDKDVTWPADGYAVIPPYTSEGKSQKIPRVFIQDYKTTATFKLGQYSLQYAYLTVPDLRATSMTLGLSVDIQWSTGLQYDDVILGGNTQVE